MAEKRTSNIMVNIEPTLMEIVERLLAKDNTSASSYCRSLILRDLQERGLLPIETLLKVT